MALSSSQVPAIDDSQHTLQSDSTSVYSCDPSTLDKSLLIERIALEDRPSGNRLIIEEFTFYLRDLLPPLVCLITLCLFQLLSMSNMLFIAFLHFSSPSIVRLRYPTFGKPRNFCGQKFGTTLGLFASSTALSLQANHPAIGIAIKEHSDFYLRPFSRLLQTILFMELALRGTPMEKEQTASWFQYLHRNVQGPMAPLAQKELGLTSSITKYECSHELKIYVLESFIWSTVSFLERFDRRLSKWAKDVLVLEFTCIGLRLDIPSDLLPRDYDSFVASFNQRLDQLAITEKRKLACEIMRDIEDGILNTKMNWITSLFLRSSLIIGHSLLPEQIKCWYKLKLLDSKWKKLRQRLMISVLWLIYPFLPSLPLRGLLSLLLLLEPKSRPIFQSSLNTVHSMDIPTDKPAYPSQQPVDLYLNMTDEYTSWLGLPSFGDTRTPALQIFLFRALEAQISSNRISAWFIYPLSLCFELLQGWCHDISDIWVKCRSQIVESRTFYSGGKYIPKLSVPNHVGLVVDGNRRFARKHGMSITQGYVRGTITTFNLMDWWINCLPNTAHSFQPNRPKYITCWVFSSGNFLRPPAEVEALFHIMEFGIKALAFTSFVHLFRIRVCVIGGEKEFARFPAKLKESIRLVEELTQEYDNYVFTLAIGYGGRIEIVESVQRIIDRNGEVNEASISSETYCARLGIPPVDLIIRTSERRTGGFFLWDTQSSELLFVDKLWSELTELDWYRSLQDFSRRIIRGGK